MRARGTRQCGEDTVGARHAGEPARKGERSTKLPSDLRVCLHAWVLAGEESIISFAIWHQLGGDDSIALSRRRAWLHTALGSHHGRTESLLLALQSTAL
jgi:hypothetical protein